ncbi:MAG: XTP/dITP diphosphatase [Syntrophomonadaceae bacterium]|nr:XTP/dITP diphosphatase [Syntrophomonadaceae bacterium]
MRLLIASHNQKKKAELAAILSEMDIEVLSLAEVGALPMVEEDGDSFTANAVKKALQTAQNSGYLSLGDDSGLVVDALDGAPGIYSARFAGEDADDARNNAKLLDMLAEVPDERRTARFICALALANPGGKYWTVEGRCEGRIDRAPHGTAGFGYDPLFIPAGQDLSFAAMAAEDKHRISHRGQALKELKRLLPQIMTQLEA